MATAVRRETVATDESLRSRVDHASGIAWSSFVCPWLRGSLRDVIWSFAWGIQPTRDRLNSWDITSTDACPYCGQRETNQHVLFECRIPRTFWHLVRRSTSVLCPVQFSQRYPNRLSVLLTACGASVLWEARCKAVARRQRNTPIYLLVRKARTLLTNELQCELLALGDDEFLRRWRFHPSLHVHSGCVTVKGAAP